MFFHHVVAYEVQLMLHDGIPLENSLILLWTWFYFHYAFKILRTLYKSWRFCFFFFFLWFVDQCNYPKFNGRWPDFLASLYRLIWINVIQQWEYMSYNVIVSNCYRIFFNRFWLNVSFTPLFHWQDDKYFASSEGRWRWNFQWVKISICSLNFNLIIFPLQCVQNLARCSEKVAT